MQCCIMILSVQEIIMRKPIKYHPHSAERQRLYCEALNQSSTLVFVSTEAPFDSNAFTTPT